MIDCEGVLITNKKGPTDQVVTALDQLSKLTNVMVNCGLTKDVV